MRGGTARPADLSGGETAGPCDATATSPPISVLFVEASSGGVLGGSLTGLYHLIRGMDRAPVSHRHGRSTSRSRSRPTWRSSTCAVHHVAAPPPAEAARACSSSRATKRAKQLGAVRAGCCAAAAQTARLLAEELPAALALARIIRRERADVIHLGNGVRANFDGILAGLLTRHADRLPREGLREVRRAANAGRRAASTRWCA